MKILLSFFVAGLLFLAANPLLSDQASADKKFTVVIDAGHGGIDKGAEYNNKLTEKEIVLKTARILKQKLQASGAKVLMSRESDQNIPLDERANLAKKEKADLFISLHVNASMQEDAKGMEVYYSDQSQFKVESKKICNSILENVVKQDENITSRGAKNANFYLLHEVNCPSVMVHMGFLSHPDDRDLLQKGEFLEAVSKGIDQSVQAMMENYTLQE